MPEIANLANGADISRQHMPQIAAEDVPEFLRFLQDKGISFEQVQEKVSNLKPTQKHINVDKVKNLVNTEPEKLYQHFIVSKGNRILDGHHRWAAIKVKNKNADVNIIRVNLPIKKLIEIGHDFDLSFTKGVMEVIKLKPIILELFVPLPPIAPFLVPFGSAGGAPRKQYFVNNMKDFIRSRGSVWKNNNPENNIRKWGAKNKEGKVKYFKTKTQALQFII